MGRYCLLGLVKYILLINILYILFCSKQFYSSPQFTHELRQCFWISKSILEGS